MTSPVLRVIYRSVDLAREVLLTVWLWLPITFLFRTCRQIPVIISVTTYPPRIRAAWMAIETLLRQTVKPEKVLLVLNLEEFPSQRLPFRLTLQTKFGLDILWVSKNGLSHDKLLPARRKFPGKTIVTFDDDKYVPRALLAQIFCAAEENPGCAIGSRGWLLFSPERDRGLRFADNWLRIDKPTRARNILTPGAGGCLYPPEALHPMVDDLESALREAPTADDLWFWAALQKNHTEIVCLGIPPLRPIRFLRATPALSGVGRAENDKQLQQVLQHFDIGPDINLLIPVRSASSE